jgi:hypothetical protein
MTILPMRTSGSFRRHTVIRPVEHDDMDIGISLSRADRADLRRALTGPGIDPAAIRDARPVEDGAFRFGPRLAMLEYYLLAPSSLWAGQKGLAAYLTATAAVPEAVATQSEAGADTLPLHALPPLPRALAPQTVFRFLARLLLACRLALARISVADQHAAPSPGRRVMASSRVIRGPDAAVLSMNRRGRLVSV